MVFLFFVISCSQEEIITVNDFHWHVINVDDKFQLVYIETDTDSIINSYLVTSDSIDEVEILRLVNDVRTNGYKSADNIYYPPVKVLKWDKDLKFAAEIHSTYMYETKNYSHNWNDYTGLAKRIEWSGYQNNLNEPITANENIAKGYKTIQDVMCGPDGSTGWMNSKPHREAIMSYKYDVIGVAKRGYRDTIGNYWTMVLAYKGQPL